MNCKNLPIKSKNFLTSAMNNVSQKINKRKKGKLIAGKLTAYGFCYIDQCLISSEIITLQRFESVSGFWPSGEEAAGLKNQGSWLLISIPYRKLAFRGKYVAFTVVLMSCPVREN